MEKFLNEVIQKQVMDVFAVLENPVAIIFFNSKVQQCEYCIDTEQLLTEVVDLSDKLTLKVYDLEDDALLANEFHVDKAPGFVIAGQEGEQVVDYGIRFYGIPAGSEFGSLISALLLVSKRQSDLNEQTRAFLSGLTKPVHLMVFATPTWPYCPQAVVLAHRMALESPMIEAEMIEASEFPGLVNQFGVNGVPQTTINHGVVDVIGAGTEQHLVNEIKKALNMN